MRTIDISKGLRVVVDDCDYDYLNRWKWSAHKGKHGAYAKRKISISGCIFMHQELIGKTPGMVIDHINGDRLDNRRSNLRVVTHAQNMCNRQKTKVNKSGYKGVRWDKARGKWSVFIGLKNKTYALGRFDDILEAARAYDVAAKRLHGEFALTNF